MTSDLDRAHAAMAVGGEAAGLAFYRALADAELFLLLKAEAEGDNLVPEVFALSDGPHLLAFDSEERLALFAGSVAPYATLPGRVIVGLMAGQNEARLSLGLNIGADAASQMILPPEALIWLAQMLDQAPPETLEARVAEFQPPRVPQAVLSALSSCLAGVGQALIVGVRYRDGRQSQMLALTGVAKAAEVRLARAVTEALAFSGVDAGALDLVFATEGDAALARMAGLALVLAGHAAPRPEIKAPVGPGLDPARPPILR